MKIYLIRHGETYGNTLKRYVGKTDESLTENGVATLKKQEKIKVDQLFVSPMKRCLQTAEILVNGKFLEIVNDLTECNFGDFENLNYLELAGNADYQKWIDSDGKLPFKNGESIEGFIERSLRGFNFCLERAKSFNNAKSFEDANGKENSIALVVHNGNIMAIMQWLFGGEYYAYSVENGKGYIIEEKSGEKTWKKF